MKKMFLFYWLMVPPLLAQKPHASFFEDSVEIGREVKLGISYSHPSESDVIFPDSTFDFSPFQYVSTEYFKTKTQNGISRDSAVYTLITFEMDKPLEIYPYLVDKNSKEFIYADTVSLVLKSSLYPNAGVLDFKANTRMYKVNREFNLPRLTFYILGFFITGLLIFLIFGDTIKKGFKLWKFDKRYRNFKSVFKKKRIHHQSRTQIQNVLTEWKVYMEEITGFPITSMSTPEIAEAFGRESLEDALNVFDRAIYGGKIERQISFAFHILNNFSLKVYRKVRKTIK